jgi:MFS transporter, Spinster family, sphingosine-1-phosphate transporter
VNIVHLPKGAYYALALVSLTQAMSLLDRQILAILAPAIKADLKIGDAEMGLLFGTVFALFYALFSLPLGRLADGWTRTKLLAICLVLWSLATGLAGFASSFALLVLSRLGVGVGEAATQPAGISLVSDYWPKHRRGFVMAVMASAIAVGIGGSLILGGVAAGWWDATYAGSTLRGWQFAFFVAAAPGFILAAFLWFLKEPERGAMDGIATPHDPHPFRASAQVLGAVVPGFNWLSLSRFKVTRKIWRDNFLWLAGIIAAMAALYMLTSHLSPRPALNFGAVVISPHLLQWGVIGFGLFVLVNFMQNMKITDEEAHRVIMRSPTLLMAFAVGTLQSVINYGMMAFNPSFLIKQYHLTMGEAALQFGLLAAVSGIVGPLLWGPLSDWLNKRFPGSGRAYVALFAMGVSPIMSFWVYHAPYALQSAWYVPDANSFYWRFIPYSFVLTGWLPPLYAIMYDQVLPRMRGITTSTYLLAMTIIGLGCGPYIVGMISDTIGDLRTAMLFINAAAVPIVVLMLFIAKRAQRDEAGLLDRATVGGVAG